MLDLGFNRDSNRSRSFPSAAKGNNYLLRYSKNVQSYALNLNARGEPAINPDDAIITSSDKGRTFTIIAKTNCIDRIMISLQHMVYLGKLKQEFIICHVLSVQGELQD